MNNSFESHSLILFQKVPESGYTDRCGVRNYKNYYFILKEASELNWL